MKLKYTKADAKAYMLRFDDMRVEGADMFEECYTHQIYGTYAAGRLVAEFALMAPDLQKKFEFLVPITENIIEVNGHADISMDRVNAMPLSLLRKKPVFFVEVDDGSHIMIDGQHRTRKAILVGKQFLRAIILPKEAVEPYRVKIMLRDRITKQWEEIDPEMDLAILEGQFGHHQLY